MLKSSAILACLILGLAAGASAKREILQTYTNSGINVIGANGYQQSDPASTQTTQPAQTTQSGQATQATPVLVASPALSPADVSGVAPATVLTIAPTTQPPATQPPATQPPATQPPATQPPAVAPSAPVLPVVAAPVPAPVQSPPPAPVVTAPAPAPATPVIPVVIPQVPAPAPVLPLPLPVTSAPVPAPVPAPAPAPVSPPLCGQKPQCRVFVEDMLCCENAGALTNKQHAVMRLQCTHPVNYYPKCFNVTGPSNLTTFNQFETAVWSTNHVSQMNILNQYRGNVSISIEEARTDQYLAGDCGLFITPCLYQGQLIDKIAPVDGISFTTIPTEDFIEVADSIDVDVDALDSLVFPNLYYPQSCQQKNIGELNSTFFSQNWVNYTDGTTYQQCNYTAFVDALAPAPAPVTTIPLRPVTPQAVSG